MNCLRCKKVISDSSDSKRVVCEKCMRVIDDSDDHIDSFDYDLGYNLDEVYD